MINFFVQMKLNKFAYIYSKPLGNHTLKIMKNTWKFTKNNLEKSWKYHGILSVRKSGNPEYLKRFCRVFDLYEDARFCVPLTEAQFSM